MSAAELKELRKEVKRGIDHADEKIVRMVRAMPEAEQDDAWADKSFVSEMDRSNCIFSICPGVFHGSGIF